MYDTVETLGKSMVHHGTCNNRVYLMKLDASDLPSIVGRLARLAERHGYTKIFAKIPAEHEAEFLRNGYRREAFIPDFYKGTTGAAFLGWYLDEARATDRRNSEVQQNLELAKSRATSGPAPKPDPHLDFGPAAEPDAEEMAQVYRVVFASYPFPIHDPAYLKETLKTNVRYFYAKRQGRIVALSSAEFDFGGQNVEMTDFATLPDGRGRGIALSLLARMEQDPKVRTMRTAYTIARSLSPGMNITFAKAGYTYGGTLTNNTDISGSIESMNVWYKALN